MFTGVVLSTLILKIYFTKSRRYSTAFLCKDDSYYRFHKSIGYMKVILKLYL
jgi:hypothetical protein